MTENQDFWFILTSVLVIVAIATPVLFLSVNNGNYCNDTTFKDREVVSLREEQGSWKSWYYVTLNDSKEYGIDREAFLYLEVGMVVNLTNCGRIVY